MNETIAGLAKLDANNTVNLAQGQKLLDQLNKIMPEAINKIIESTLDIIRPDPEYKEDVENLLHDMLLVVLSLTETNIPSKSLTTLSKYYGHENAVMSGGSVISSAMVMLSVSVYAMMMIKFEFDNPDLDITGFQDKHTKHVLRAVSASQNLSYEVCQERSRKMGRLAEITTMNSIKTCMEAFHERAIKVGKRSNKDDE